ncbi:hypothetical protein SEA_JUMBO_5 [Gordonia phage Jumbo]|uniref:DNA primase n=1 Tax=Gordonia phage Jumbo TaxID=1887650 RepID=A0A1B3B0K0_9CAUD|nr:DNA primase [Gordonia phage Jumbo]AOE44519.1 hypothetical protein SEA_JUMBO_5 [Gordonia phage Jumbo]
MTLLFDPRDRHLQGALSRLLIARPDVVAIQRQHGGYAPLHADGCPCASCNPAPTFAQEPDPPIAPVFKEWTYGVMEWHLLGQDTCGHYVLNGDKAKFFCFDLDFTTKNTKQLNNPREHWTKTDGQDPWLRWQLAAMTQLLTYRIERAGFHTMATFSGSKGVHVYGFIHPGQVSLASDLREAALWVLKEMGYFWLPKNSAGINFQGNPACELFCLFDLEVFPKQNSVEPGGFGNLMRMELGINRKSGKPGFIIDTHNSNYSLEPAQPLPVLENLLNQV